MAQGRQRQQGGQDRGGPKTVIKVGYTEPIKEEESNAYGSTLFAFVKRGDKPEPSLLVQFEVDGMQIGNPQSTNPLGRTTLYIYNLEPRSHKIAAQIIGTVIRDEVVMPIGIVRSEADKQLTEAEGASNLAVVQARQAQAEADIVLTQAQIAKAKKEIQDATTPSDPEIVTAEKAVRLAELNKRLADSTKTPDVLDPELAGAKKTVDLTDLLLQQTQKEKAIADLTKETPKIAAKLVVNQTKEGEKYFFDFVVLTQDDIPVNGAVVRVIDPENPQGFFDLVPTGADGSTKHKVEVATSKKIIVIRVLGTAINTWRYLFKE